MDETAGIEQKIAEIEAELANLDHHRSQLLKELAMLRQQVLTRNTPTQLALHLQQTPINNQTAQEEKIRLFRSLFRGREDVVPRRFENTKTGKSGYAPVCRNEWAAGICQKPKIACQECNFRAFVPVSDEIIRNHLRGNDPQEYSAKDFTIGVYPLLTDETCCFLAVDFDKTTWADDARAFLETCAIFQVPAILVDCKSCFDG